MINAWSGCLVTRKAAATKDRVRVKKITETVTSGSAISARGLARWRKTLVSGSMTSSTSTHEPQELTLMFLRLKIHLRYCRSSFKHQQLLIINVESRFFLFTPDHKRLPLL